MPPSVYPRIASFKNLASLRQHLAELGLDLPLDDRPLAAEDGSPLAATWQFGNRTVGNRWCIHPMEGWDGTADGHPTSWTFRRWSRFGQSGAKLIWGGEAVAVRPDGRANPRQLLATPRHVASLRSLRETLEAAHRDAGFSTDDLVVGLQLTHSGRFSRPHDHGRPEPRIWYRHPWLDRRVGLGPNDNCALWRDEELEALIDDYVSAAGVAQEAGFAFVDIKACHGYFLHEGLSAFDRPGPFGGSYENRTRLLRQVIEAIREALPALMIGVRLSIFDRPPYTCRNGCGVPEPTARDGPYRWGFGLDPDNPLQTDWTEPDRLLADLEAWGVTGVNVSAGSPYYCPHVQRPAAFPPSDGYPPPEDPIAGAVRLLQAARHCRRAVRSLAIVATGLTYFQDYVPHVAQAIVREGWCDAAGLGRMVLSYPSLPGDVLAGKPLDRRRICRTFSDCTTAPRNGLISGCYPLDPSYKELPDARLLRDWKKRNRVL